MARRSFKKPTALLAALILLSTSTLNTFAANENTWPTPNAENKLWTRWWWMGNAVDAPNITRQLEQFQKAGLGGVEICPIYGVYGAENRYIDFLSPQWVDLLAHTAKETKRLGIKLDMTTGTGWPFGGKSITEEDASKGLVLKWFTTPPTPADLPKGKLIALLAYAPNNPQPQDVTTAKIEHAQGTRYLAAVQAGPMQKVKRSAPGGEGNVLDPYTTSSISKYLSGFDAALRNFPADLPRAQFHDSFEYYGASWTPTFFADFQKRRGYDLKPHLADLAPDAPASDTAARIRHDYRETLSDLHHAYMQTWADWSHSHNTLARNQAHGGPGNLIDVYANADIPECEIFHLYDETQLPHLKFASSAAHLTGKKLASSESFTWLGEHFSVPLSEVKPAADFLLLAGVNHMLLHGIPYSPEDAAWPGWNFYASVNFGPSGGIWKDMPALAAYIARCQSILQDNKPANDLLLYAPFHEFWTVSDPKNLMTQFTNPGAWMKPFPYYSLATSLTDTGILYDEISDALIQEAKVNPDGTLDMAGNAYKTLLIPQTSMIPVDTLKKLIALANDGATIAFHNAIPTDVPGYTDLAKRKADLAALINSIPLAADKEGIQIATVGRGKILVLKNVAALAPLANVPVETMTQDGLRCIRRLRPDGYDYFVVNRSDKPVSRVRLGTPATSAIILDPRFDNRIGALPVTRTDAGQTINLTLAPGESYFVRTFTSKPAEGPTWLNAQPAPNPTPLTGTWSVTFTDGGPALPKPMSMSTLASWTTNPDPEAQRFAGTAKYSLSFDLPPGGGGGGSGNGGTMPQIVGHLLDLGKVADSARVSLNGKPLATLWSAPYSLLLTPDLLIAGKNTLDIEVSNVAANRIRDMDRRGVQWKIFRDINVVNTGYTAMDASKWPIRDAGLLGPVTLSPLATPKP